MDSFGVLVQNYGIKPQGKSAPMAASKTDTKTHNYNSFQNQDHAFKSTNEPNSTIGSFLNKNDIFGLSSSTQNTHQNNGFPDVFVDVFQMPNKSSTTSNGGDVERFDLDMDFKFMGSGNLSTKSSDVGSDDLIWGFSGKTRSNVVVESHDLLSSDPVDDFLGNLGRLGLNSVKGLNEKRGDKIDGDDLIPGFGRTNGSIDRAQASSAKKSAGVSFLNEFEDFAAGKIKKNATGNLNAFKFKPEPNKTSQQELQETNFFDIEGSSNGDSALKNMGEIGSENLFQTEATDLDSFFSAHTRQSVPVSENKSMGRTTEEIPDLFFGTTSSKEKEIPSRNFPDDLSSIFGGPPSFGPFEEVEGESEQRRRARFERHQRTEARMAQALADMNQRDSKVQLEQEERHRIAEAMDVQMKRWAAGKEGNLRALLSSLQQVLGPEFCWRPVTLTDLITSSQVKIAYKKAALCVHPDKVQQKGANLQQKFVAEKVFDLLKEAWNKFNSEELR